MATQTRRVGRETEIAFDTVSIEGGLLAADWLTRVAQLVAGQQAPEDYGVPKGLEIRDEIGRYWRIAQAHWREFELGLRSKAEPNALVRRFVYSLLRDALGFSDLQEVQTSGPLLFEGGMQPPSSELPMLMVGERVFPIAAFGRECRVPIVLAPAGAGLDVPRQDLGDGHRRRSAFGLAQEFLNSTDQALWGLCSDGLSMRLVRDNASLTRPAWVEIDLVRMFSEDLYPDFAAVWLLLHATRFGRPNQLPEECPLEAWRAAGRKEGTRARDRLREGFEDALICLGQGFLGHSGNHLLRKSLHEGSLNKVDFFGQLLRLVYRLIFLLTVEERGLLHPKKTPNEVKERYAVGYSLQRLRDRSSRRAAHDRHTDVWEGVKIVFDALARGEERLGLPALAGIFAQGQCPDLDRAKLDNRAFLRAMFSLCWLQEPSGLARVNWRDMGPDELGYVYEGLLELVPQITEEGRNFTFAGREESRGNARKTSGSYYTPDSLVEILLDSALEPVIEKTLAMNPNEGANSLLRLTVVDPACGSGHFLLAAARRLAERIARLKSDGTPTPEEYRHALRQVVGKCIYGVDLNPLAVELCKVALWMEAVDPGLPLTFLDAHIRQGNALLGTTRALMSEGIPDEAWVALEGDEPKLANSLKKRNRAERGGQQLLPFGSAQQTAKLREAVDEVEVTPDTDSCSLAQKEQRWAELLASEPWRHEKLVHDAWCAAFLWPKTEAGDITAAAPTHAVWRALANGGRPSSVVLETTDRIATDYALFHWELAFPQVFENGGFDVVLGNPPWEHLEKKEEEFFADRDAAIASATNAAARKRLIADLVVRAPELYAEWQSSKRISQGATHFARTSGRYRLCARGRINTYPLFAEHNWKILSSVGRAGFIVPSGIATDDNTKDFFAEITRLGVLRSLWEFENEGFFTAGKGHMLRFALTTLSGQDDTSTGVDFMFQGQAVSDLDDPQRHFTLDAKDIETINPNTGTCPIFRTRRDAEITLSLFRRNGVFWHEANAHGNPWGIRFMQGTFNLSSDSGVFRTRGELSVSGWHLNGNRFMKGDQVMLPLYEAKMAYMFNHRSGTYEGAAPGERPHRLPTPSVDQLADPSFATLPFYWVTEAEVNAKLDGVWDRHWLIAWRDVTDARASVRSVVAFVLPRVGVGHSTPLMFPSTSPRLSAALLACLSSFPLDYAARQKIGGLHLTYGYLKQLPVLPPATYANAAAWSRTETVLDWIMPRILELTYTAWDLQPFAQDCGDDGPPFIWNVERRFRLQCELDAAFFHLYGVTRDDVDFILGTFDVLERAEIRAHGEFRTKQVVLEIYDALAEAAKSGRHYVSPLPASRRTEV